MILPNHIFRAYDVRGVYPTDLDEKVAYILGKAFAEMLGGSGRVLVGRDVRLSGEVLASSIASGLADGGMDVYGAGIVPTPALYLGVVENRFDGGVQVTASHNPPEWNGFKFVLANGDTISEGFGMEKLREIAHRFGSAKPNITQAFKEIDIADQYIRKISSLLSLKRKVRVAVDFSNGATCILGKDLLRGIGCELAGINDRPDGRFPAHLPEPGPETLKELAYLVPKLGMELGVGFDGDGDRAVFVDDEGRIIEGDIALGVLVMRMGRRGRVVYDVSCSSALEEVIRSAGCEPIICRVGRAFMLRKVREVGAIVGGEKSNHFYFYDIYGFDDGIYAAAKMAEIISRVNEPFSSLIDSIPRYPASPIKTVNAPDEVKFRAVERVAEKLKQRAEKIIDIDGIKAYLDKGWILIRPSNTMPQIKYVAEAKDEETLKSYVALAEKLIYEAIAEINT